MHNFPLKKVEQKIAANDKSFIAILAYILLVSHILLLFNNAFVPNALFL